MIQEENCCPTLTNVPVETCFKTEGPYGEIINEDPTNTAINAPNVIIPVPVDPTDPTVSVYLRLGFYSNRERIFSQARN